MGVAYPIGQVKVLTPCWLEICMHAVRLINFCKFVVDYTGEMLCVMNFILFTAHMQQFVELYVWSTYH